MGNKQGKSDSSGQQPVVIQTAPGHLPYNAPAGADQDEAAMMQMVESLNANSPFRKEGMWAWQRSNRFLPELEAAFKAKDPDNTGFLTPEEFKVAFASLGEDKVDVSEVSFFLMGSGERVDYKEWLRVKTASRDNNAPPQFSF